MIILITRFLENRDVIYDSGMHKMALSNHDGCCLTDFEYDLIYCLCRGYLCGIKDDEHWLLDWNGDRVTNLPVDEIKALGESMFSARLDDKYFLMNQYGSPLTQDKYDYIGRFKNGYARVNLGKIAGYLTKSGDELFRARFKINT